MSATPYHLIPELSRLSLADLMRSIGSMSETEKLELDALLQALAAIFKGRK